MFGRESLVNFRIINHLPQSAIITSCCPAFGVIRLSWKFSRKPFAALAFVLSGVLVLTSCSPSSVFSPPGDIVSSITPLSSTPDAAPQLSPMSASLNGLTSETEDKPQEKKQVATLFSPQSLLGRSKPAESRCQRQLRRLGVQFNTPPPVVGAGSCGIANPVKVKSLSGGIDVVPDAMLNCPMALAFAKWVKNELSGAARLRYVSGIKSIHQMSSYSCRTMNSKRGAPMSEHSKGNALDIGKIKLNSGKTIVVKRPGFFAFREKGLLHKVRAQSCKYFTTVLGPGSDVHHKDHFHFDLRKRKTAYRHCDL